MNQNNPQAPAENPNPVAQTPQAEAKLAEDAAFYASLHVPNLPLGIVAGVIAALVGAAIWAAVTAATEYQIGWMAVGVGVLVGLAVRKFGKGDSEGFAVLGAVLALAGCLLGNLLAVVAIAASGEDARFWDFLFSLTPDLALTLMKITFSPMDLLFYGIAIYEGWKFSIRRA